MATSEQSTERTVETVKAELEANRQARAEATGSTKGLYTKAVKKLEAELKAMEPSEGQGGDEAPQQPSQQQPTSDEQDTKASKRAERINERVAKGQTRQEARKAEGARTVHDTPQLLDLIGSEPLTMEQLAEQTGHELTPSFKRRIGWLTDKDGLLVRKVEGRGKSRKTTFVKA